MQSSRLRDPNADSNDTMTSSGTKGEGNLVSTGNISGNFIGTWILKRFSKLGHAPGRLYESPFIRSSARSQRWFLRIYPGGSAVTDSVGFVSLYLCSLVDYGKKMQVRYVIDLRNTDEKIIEVETTRSMNFGSSWGYPQLIERSVLLSELPDDVLVIQVKVNYSQAFITRSNGISEIYPEINSELICDGMRWLHDEKSRADVVILVSGKEKILAHRSVLAARSKVFAAKFKHDSTEMSSRSVNINFDIDSVEALLQFMYTGSIESLTIGLAKDMLRASVKYRMNDLKIYCGNYLISRFNIEIQKRPDVPTTAALANPTRVRSKRKSHFQKNVVFLSYSKVDTENSSPMLSFEK